VLLDFETVSYCFSPPLLETGAKRLSLRTPPYWIAFIGLFGRLRFKIMSFGGNWCVEIKN